MVSVASHDACGMILRGSPRHKLPKRQETGPNLEEDDPETG